ncbi:calcium/sodium antiporter [Spirabiliibacterium falconis]|uniref:calcium/sodium antiporter n=1 Tax=Spirabiliibacterium falconis TaxID=572023 RepID=UPI001AACC43F|nr:calcium/sodium antiporter [Spirabiliibacterium falconis]MBE2893994.1 calcium/sodium antiporter [Spirabiliibacterium falconis]
MLIFAILAIIIGLAVLVWSADRFVEGSSAVANHFGMPKILIGMLIIGFGTSAPEIVVSVTSAIEGTPGIALGNAYGSNIANLALILGVTAIISPILVAPATLRKELPLLLLVTLISIGLLYDGNVSRFDGIMLLLLFVAFMAWSIYQGLRAKYLPQDEITIDPSLSLGKALLLLCVGLLLLVASSQLLVWGAVYIAQALGVSDLIIGLTVIAIGTSLPELASSISAARQQQHDLALGNVIGSNMFNTLAVVGLAGTIKPMHAGFDVVYRDMPVMLLLTLLLFVIGYRYRAPSGHIHRWAGVLLLLCYIAYNGYIFLTLR